MRRRDARHNEKVTSITPQSVTVGTLTAAGKEDDPCRWWKRMAARTEGEVNGMADKKVTPKAATKPAPKQSTGAATRVTKVALKKKKKK